MIWRLALPAGRFNRFLKIHLKVKKITEGLGEKLGLAQASRGADGKNRHVVLKDKRRAQRMRWKFSRRQLVGMAGNQIESGHAVVQNYAGSVDHDATAEAMVHALYERCPVAELVRSCDVRRIVSCGGFGSA